MNQLRHLSTLLTFAFLILTFDAFSQEKEKKWDVNAPAGQLLNDVNFTTDEGTWMNLDVSPDGLTVVFDLLGDIYLMPISGGAATCLRSGMAWESQPRFSPDGRQILFTSDAGGGDNCWTMKADGSKSKQITKESFRLLNNGAWISDEYFVARKHFTNTRSLGAGEIWMYHISGGEGIQITKRKNDQQDVNEPSVSRDGRYIYYSEDVYPGGFFQYNKDVNDEIFVINRYDREKGESETIISGGCRPQISPDGKRLAYVRRVRLNTVLVIHNLETGEEVIAWDGLSKDQMEAWTTFGCFPGFAWMPDNKNLVIWSNGKINKANAPFFPYEKSKIGNFTDKPLAVENIPFSVEVRTKVAETLHFQNPAFEEKFTAHAIRQATTSPDGKTLVFNAAGFLYKKMLPNGQPERLTSGTDLEFEPAFSPDGRTIIFVSWNDLNKGAIQKISISGGSLTKITTEPGIYRTPQFSPNGNQIIYRKEDGNDHQGFTFCKKPGNYLMNADGSQIKFVTPQGENPRFSADGKRIFVQKGGYLFGSLKKSLVSFDLEGHDEKTIFNTQYTNQFVPSPDGKWIAFTELHKAFVAEMPNSGQPIGLSGDTKAMPVACVSRDAGYNLQWSADGKQLHYTLGDEYFTINLKDRFTFLPDSPDSLPALDTMGLKIGLILPADKPSGTTIFSNARIITMEGDEVIENGDIVIKDNMIIAVGKSGTVAQPTGGTFIDCTGKTIMPGIIDVHAHSGNFRFGISPNQQWEYLANLAYGVTTSHDPSTNSEMVFSQSEMLKSGKMVGPRLFSTGTILYGADGDFKAPINSLDDARATLRRTRAWGAFSVKSYNQPRREQRQWVIAAARELKMEVVPEGGSFFFHNMTQVVDGHTGIEHNIPVAPLFKDVTTLWGKTKTHNTPTLIVNYGGLNGEYYWYQNTEVWNKKRLLTFTPKYIIDGRSRDRTMAPDEEYQNGHILVAKSCKKLADAGVKINLGAHGQLQGLGAHWELWNIAQGGFSNLEALKSATINGAVYLGMESQIGSLKVGKLADLIILEKNPLENIQNSEFVKFTMLNGRLYDAETMHEIGNSKKERMKFWWELPGAGAATMPVGFSTGRVKCVCGQ
jgi:imidazolonepropionase-like amidohydrolase/Tol biopolymer transport system component